MRLASIADDMSRQHNPTAMDGVHCLDAHNPSLELLKHSIVVAYSNEPKCFIVSANTLELGFATKGRDKACMHLAQRNTALRKTAMCCDNQQLEHCVALQFFICSHWQALT